MHEEIPCEAIMKTCRYCLKEKDLSEFVKDKNNKDGHQRICYDCKSIANKKRNFRKRNSQYYFDGNKEAALKRDGYKCTVCGIKREHFFAKTGFDLCIHHKDENGKGVPKDKKNNSLDNLQTLCIPCHASHHRNMRCKNTEGIYADKPAKKECPHCGVAL